MENVEKNLASVPRIGYNMVQNEESVDATTRKLLRRLEQIEMEQARLRIEHQAITTALGVAGVALQGFTGEVSAQVESEYEGRQPFAKDSLTDACLRVLRDHAGAWLTKAQVEYMVVRGGYKFSTANPKNSVKITLHRLAHSVPPRCEVQSNKQGNQYRSLEATEERRNAVTE
jgi:hypothetical protein